MPTPWQMSSWRKLNRFVTAECSLNGEWLSRQSSNLFQFSFTKVWWRILKMWATRNCGHKSCPQLWRWSMWPQVLFPRPLSAMSLFWMPGSLTKAVSLSNVRQLTQSSFTGNVLFCVDPFDALFAFLLGTLSFACGVRALEMDFARVGPFKLGHHVENVSPVSSFGPSALFALIVALDAPQLPATVCEKHQCWCRVWPTLIVIWLLFIDTEFSRTKNKTKVVQQPIPYSSVNS